MAIKSVEISELESKAANVYEAIVVLSKRARQINEETKLEFNQRLETISILPSSSNPEEEEPDANPDQLRISLEFEKRPKPTEEAIREILNDELKFRYKEPEAPASVAE
ncbi:MAG: DNA-directed RNA polymerase subunit omega [Ignavibacteriales bacterium]|jgi:DNA-directed RNA polymerase subunit K/omega|nr:DNA-directed RNA polymerase subunit omega [Ignavibacteriales bacterium]